MNLWKLPSEDMNWSSGEDATGEAGEKHKHEHEHEEHTDSVNLRVKSTQDTRGQQGNFAERSQPPPATHAEPSAAISSITSTATNKHTARPHPCAHCDKRYELRKDLNRHNKQSRCAKTQLSKGAHAAAPSLPGLMKGCGPTQVLPNSMDAHKSMQNNQSPNPAAGTKRKAAESLSFDLEQPDSKTARTAGPEINNKLEIRKRVSRKKPPVRLRNLLRKPVEAGSSSNGDKVDRNITHQSTSNHNFSGPSEFPAANQDGIHNGIHPIAFEVCSTPSDQLDIDETSDVTEINSWSTDIASQQIQQSPQQPQPSAMHSTFHQSLWDNPLDGSLLVESANSLFAPSVWPSTYMIPEPPFQVHTEMSTTGQHMGDSQSLNALLPLTNLYGPDYHPPITTHFTGVRCSSTAGPLELQQFPDGHLPGDYGLYQSLPNPLGQSYMLQQSPILQQALGDIPSSASRFSTIHPWEVAPLSYNEDRSQVLPPNWLSQQNASYSEQLECDINIQDGVGHVDPPPFDWEGQRDQNVTASDAQIQETSHSPLDLSRSQSPPASQSPPRFERRPASVGPSQPAVDFSIHEDDASSRRKLGRPSMDAADDSLKDIGNSNPRLMVPSTAVGARRHKLKVPSYPDLTVPMTVMPSSLPTTTDIDPALNLKIKGLTDNADTTITIRRSQKFGPFLNHYCEERGKQYLTEWNFVYWFRTPVPEDPDKQCGHNLRWRMTPNSFMPSDSQPYRQMNDGDVIEVLEGAPLDYFGRDVAFNPPDVAREEEPVYTKAKVNEELVRNRADEIDYDHNHDQDQDDEQNEDQYDEQHDEQNDEQMVRWLQAANAHLHKENQKFHNKIHAVDRLQTAYDAIRRVYENQRHENINLHSSNAQLRNENATLLREIERLSGTSPSPHSLPMAQTDTSTLGTSIEVHAPVPRYPVPLPHLRRTEGTLKNTTLSMVEYPDSDDDYRD